MIALPKPLNEIKFGTDGWRAVIAKEFTFSNLGRVTQAYADYIRTAASGQSCRVAIAYDNRFSADLFAEHAARVLMGNGIEVHLLKPAAPTPLLSFIVTRGGYAGGVVITASHNPPEYCGFKIKESFGGSAFEECTAAVESLIDQKPVVFDPHSTIMAVPKELENAYKLQLSSLINLDAIRSGGMNVIVDSMHGTAGAFIENLLGSNSPNVKTIRAERDCLFGGNSPEPIDRNLSLLKRTVLNENATVGLANDGDADRLGVVDNNGKFMTMHDVAPLLLLHLAREKKLRGKVVVTVTQSVVMQKIAQKLKLPFLETPVGFKYIAREMLNSDVLIGAEESGGIGIKGHIPERDGIFNGLLLLEALAVTKLKPSEYVNNIKSEFGCFFYDRLDLSVPIEHGQTLIRRLSTEPPETFCGVQVTGSNSLDGIKLQLKDDAWIMFRQSGTEPVLRIYCETPEEQQTQRLLKAARSLAEVNHSS